MEIFAFKKTTKHQKGESRQGKQQQKKEGTTCLGRRLERVRSQMAKIRQDSTDP